MFAKQTIVAFLLITVAFTAPLATGQGSNQAATAGTRLPELFLNVDGPTTARFARPSYFGLRQQLYFAKPGRQRIVKIDFDLLQQEGATFTMTAFPGEQLTVVARTIAGPGSTGERNFWKGTILAPTRQIISINGRAPRPEELESLREIGLTVSTLTIDVSSSMKRELLSGDLDPNLPMIGTIAPKGGDSVASVLSAGNLADNPEAVLKMRAKIFSGRWVTKDSKSQIIIRAIEDDPRFHVVYEQDAAKLPRQDNSAADTARSRAYSDFTRALQAERKRYEQENSAQAGAAR